MRFGIDLGGTKIEGIVLGDNGDIIARKHIATPQNSIYTNVINAICGLVVDLDQQIDQTCTVGIGIPSTLCLNH